MNINKLIEMAIEKGASDVHLNVGIEPSFRIDGKLKRINELPPVTEERDCSYIKTNHG